MNEFLLDEKITPEFIEYLGRFGEVKILCDLDPPFYSCTREGYFTVKGMLDDANIHIRFNHDSLEAAKEIFQEMLSEYPKHVS